MNLFKNLFFAVFILLTVFTHANGHVIKDINKYKDLYTPSDLETALFHLKLQGWAILDINFTKYLKKLPVIPDPSWQRVWATQAVRDRSKTLSDYKFLSVDFEREIKDIGRIFQKLINDSLKPKESYLLFALASVNREDPFPHAWPWTPPVGKWGIPPPPDFFEVILPLSEEPTHEYLIDSGDPEDPLQTEITGLVKREVALFRSGKKRKKIFDPLSCRVPEHSCQLSYISLYYFPEHYYETKFP
jgi:hypothetical protein